MIGIPSGKLPGLHEILNGSVELEEKTYMLCCHLERLWPGGRRQAVSLPQTDLHVLAHGGFSCTMILSRNWKREFSSGRIGSVYFPEFTEAC